MELRQLEYFVAVAEEANFTRAAAKVHVAQPGVSAQIRRLERELGHTLLDRSGRTVRLTEAGAELLPYARAALGAVEGARLAADQLAGLVRGRVAVGMVTSFPAVDLADLLASFHHEHPGVEITLAEDNSDRLIDGLREGRLDLAVVGLATAPPEGIESEVMVDEALVAAVRHDDVLAKRATIGFKALADRALISLPRGTGLRAAVDAAAARLGVRPRIAFEASDPVILAQLAARGLGVAILPASLAQARAATLHAVSITKPRLRSRLDLAWRSDGPVGPAARLFIARARTTLTPPSG